MHCRSDGSKEMEETAEMGEGEGEDETLLL